VVADCRYHSAEFMPWNQGVLGLVFPFEDMNVRAANARCMNTNEDIIVSHLGDICAAKFDLAGRCDSSHSHGFSACSFVMV
jgi:hypothetical protein